MSTLKSVQLADLLVHVVDASSDEAENQITAVRDVLTRIEAAHVPELLVFNKSDLAPERSRQLVARHPGSVAVCALTGEGLDGVIIAIAEQLRVTDRVVTLRLPLDRGDLVARAHREGEVLETTTTDDAVVLRVALDAVGASHFAAWRAT